MTTVIGSRAMRPSESTPLSDDWSPAEIWLAIGDERSYELQRGIDEFKSGRSVGTCEHSCEVHDDLAESHLLHKGNVIAAITGEKTLSKAAKRRILAALDIPLD